MKHKLLLQLMILIAILGFNILGNNISSIETTNLSTISCDLNTPF